MTRQRIDPADLANPAPAGAKTTREISVIAIDAGLASLGLCEVTGDPARGVGGMKIAALEFFATKKADKKARRKIRVSTDDHRRVAEFADRLVNAIRTKRPSAIAVEWYQPTTSFSTAARPNANGWKAALVVGAVIGVGRALGIPVLEQLSLDKKSLGKEIGDKVATGGKEDVEAWLCRRLPGFKARIMKIAKSNREHPVDAAAHAVLAFRELLERRAETVL